MVEAIAATKREPFALVDRKTLVGLTDYILPVGMSLVFLFSLLLVVQRGSELRFWSEDHSGSGDFLVESCRPNEAFGADRWICSGRLTAENSTQAAPAALATSMGAYASHRPYVGERFQVFHPTDDDTTVYPLQYKLNELARLYLSLIPRLLIMVGALIWLAGWFLTRRHDPDDFVARDAIRAPQRFNWRAKGITWILSGLLVLGLNYWLTTRVIGSLDII